MGVIATVELNDLQRHIRALACLQEASAPVISCYLNLEKGEAGYRNALDERVRALRGSLEEEEQRAFEYALGQIETYIATKLPAEAKGAALFSRGGMQSFFLPFQFQVPLPNWISIDSTPNIFHLVELKDTYHRYVVLISTEKKAGILEVNLGSVTKQLWMDRPELRKRVGREWTKRHHQSHRRERTTQFIRQKIKILEKLMSDGGYAPLILAGHPQMTCRVRNELPKHLAAHLIDTVTASGTDAMPEVVASTLASFIEHEERESVAAAADLGRQIRTEGLAVAGTDETLRALRRSQVDVLVIAKVYEPDPGWSCAACGSVGTDLAARPSTAMVDHSGLPDG